MATNRIAFVTDSTAFLTEELKKHPDVYVVPMVIIANGKEYEDGIDLSTEQLYEMIRTEKEVPKTSQPNVDRFKDLYEKLNQEYEQIIAIHVSSKLSGTISSSTTAKEQVGLDIEIVDSCSLAFAITFLLEIGIAMAEKGIDAKKIAAELRGKATKHKNVILLHSLEQLFKGGRMSGAQFILGNLLHIKPILSIGKEGELGLTERIRSEKKATRRIIEVVEESSKRHGVTRIGVMHANAMGKARTLKDMMTSRIPSLEVVIGNISSTLAVHAGEGAIAVFWSE